MGKNMWDEVDDYLGSLREADPVLASALDRSTQAGLPDITVAPEQGRLLTVLASAAQARMILEIGTLGGYSAICLARALPTDGRLVTLERDEPHAEVARENLSAAGFADQVEVLVGPALESLPVLHATYPNGFDFVFIDADKENYPEYWRWALRLSHPGTLIVADNVVRDGEVANPETEDPRAQGVQEYLRLVAEEALVVDASIQTVGVKGHDGLSFAVVLGETG